MLFSPDKEKETEMIRIGLDVGSTTLKCVVLNDRDEILYKNYERHYSQITQKAAAMLSEVRDQFPEQERVQLCVSGSAGMGFAESMSIPFAQESTPRASPSAATCRRRTW